MQISRCFYCCVFLRRFGLVSCLFLVHISRDTGAHASSLHRSFSNASVDLGTGYCGLSCTTTLPPERRLFPHHLHGPIAPVWPHHDISATCHPSGRGRARSKSSTCARRALCTCMHGHLRATHMSRDTRAHSSSLHRIFSNASVALGTGYRGLSCTKTVQPERRLFPHHLHGPIARVSLCVSLVAAAFLDF